MTVLSFLRAQEGGPTKSCVLAQLKRAGIPARGTTSCYVGHTAVAILTENKRLLKRAERIVYGRGA